MNLYLVHIQSDVGLKRFAGNIISTMAKLLSMMIAHAIKQNAINKGKAMGEAIAGATQSGGATGPAAIFTTPAFIATAIAGILAAFAAIPKFADGGVVGGDNGFSLATVGERGMETVAMPTGTRVVSHADSMKAIGGDGQVIKLQGNFIVEGEDLVYVIDEYHRKEANTA